MNPIARHLADAAPAARDQAFELAVMARIEQRRFHRALGLQLGLAGLAAVALAASAPVLEMAWREILPLIGRITTSNLTVAALLLAALAALWPFWDARTEEL